MICSPEPSSGWAYRHANYLKRPGTPSVYKQLGNLKQLFGSLGFKASEPEGRTSVVLSSCVSIKLSFHFTVGNT